MPLQKQKRIMSKNARDSARGEMCTLQISGICCGGTDTTVLAHLPDESHGMAKKSDDISSCYACASCHDAADSRKAGIWPNDAWADFVANREWYFRRAMVRTWRRMIENGVIVIK